MSTPSRWRPCSVDPSEGAARTEWVLGEVSLGEMQETRVSEPVFTGVGSARAADFLRYAALTRAGAFTKSSSTKPTASTSAMPRMPYSVWLAAATMNTLHSSDAIQPAARPVVA